MMVVKHQRDACARTDSRSRVEVVTAGLGGVVRPLDMTCIEPLAEGGLERTELSREL